MKRSLFRMLLLSVALMIVAFPASAQYDECKDCRRFCDLDNTCYQFCGTPVNNSWGKETCELEIWRNVQVCKTRGNGCYYFEVQG